MDRTEHSVMATIIGGLHPDAIQVVEGIGGVKVGIQPAVTELRASAHQLVDRMLAVTEATS